MGRNHRNLTRLTFEDWFELPSFISSLLGAGDLIAWELGGNGPGNLLGNWESALVSRARTRSFWKSWKETSRGPAPHDSNARSAVIRCDLQRSARAPDSPPPHQSE